MFAAQRFAPAAAIAMLAAFASGPAAAACFEDVGCTNNQTMSTAALKQLSCDALWTVRNTIYDENGYCFKTARGKAVFSNAGCSYSNAASVPLNSYERTNISKVVAVEKQKGC